MTPERWSQENSRNNRGMRGRGVEWNPCGIKFKEEHWGWGGRWERTEEAVPIRTKLM